MDFVIAVDGPAASGKGTVAVRLASLYRLPYLDTGLIYRAVGVAVVKAGGDPSDAAQAEAQARALVLAQIDEAEARVRHAVPEARIMYLEPDVYRATEAEVSSLTTQQGSSEDTPG